MPSGYLYSWTGRLSTSFSNAGNWYNQITGATATAIPGVNDEATVTTGGTLAGSGSVFELGLTGNGSGLVATGALSGAYVYVGGSLTLAGGASLSSPNFIDIGDNSSASLAGKVPTVLTVGAGALLNATFATANGFDILVGQNGGSGTLAITGSGARAQAGSAGFWVGNQGSGLITVGGGGQITGGTGAGASPQQIGVALGIAGGSGTLSLTDAGSGATFGDIVDVGYGGTGTISVASGATLTAGDGLNSLTLGDADGSAIGTGTAMINGATATLNGLIEDGSYGQGSLSITGGSSVTVSSSATSGTSSYWSALLGAITGGSGTLAVAGQSQVTMAHGIGVGSAGHGEVDVSSATLVINQVAGNAFVALDAGLATGTSGLITIMGGLVEDTQGAGVIIGGVGSGTLAVGPMVSQGGTLLCGGAVGLALGVNAGSSGTATIGGASSQVSVAGQLSDGNSGTGTIAVSAGAKLNAGLSGTTTGLVIAGNGGSGSLSMDSGGQTGIYGQAVVGQLGSGTLSVSSGGYFGALASGNSALVLGALAGSTGTMLITDSASHAQLIGGLTVGNAGNGTFTLQNNAYALVTSNSANALPAIDIAAAGGASKMTVTGPGTSLTALGQVLVGGQGGGIGGLVVSAGGSMTVINGSGQTIPGVVIGTGTGTLTSFAIVTGAGTSLTIAGELAVGHTENGQLTISAGAHVTAGSVAASDLPGGHGTILLNGAGSTLATGALQIGGASGAGALVAVLGSTVSASGPITVNGSVALGGATFATTGTLSVGAGSTVIGQGTVSAAAIVDLGRIGVNSGTLACIGPVTGNGLLSLGGNASLMLGSSESAGVGVAFAAGGGTLTAQVASAIAGTISGWSAGDVIDLKGSAAASATFSGHTLQLYGAAGQVYGTLTLGGSLATHNFTVTQVAGEGAVIAYHG